jgi:hypothetical protein
MRLRRTGARACTAAYQSRQLCQIDNLKLPPDMLPVSFPYCATLIFESDFAAIAGLIAATSGSSFLAGRWRISYTLCRSLGTMNAAENGTPIAYSLSLLPNWDRKTVKGPVQTSFKEPRGETRFLYADVGTEGGS